MPLITAEDLGITDWHGIEREHIVRFLKESGWTYGELSEVLGVSKGYLWAIVQGKSYMHMNDKLRKRVWAALLEPVNNLPYYLANVARRAKTTAITRAVPWEKIRGGLVKECVGCGEAFVAFRKDTKYHSGRCGRDYRRRVNARLRAAAAADA